MSSIPAVLLAAGGVGLAHSVLPDHWVPLAVMSRTRRDPLRKVARVSLLAGVAHVAVSLVLGGIVIAVGLSIRSAIESRTNDIVGGVLIATGIAFLIAEATGHTHAAKHHEHDHHDEQHDGEPHDGEPHDGEPHDGEPHDGEPHDDQAEGDRRLPRGLSLLIPFGAAASPDLTILPVFLAAATLGTGAALGSLAVFTAVTLATFVGLTTLAAAGGYQITSPWLDRYANTVTAVVIITIGGLVATNSI